MAEYINKREAHDYCTGSVLSGVLTKEQGDTIDDFLEGCTVSITDEDIIESAKVLVCDGLSVRVKKALEVRATLSGYMDDLETKRLLDSGDIGVYNPEETAEEKNIKSVIRDIDTRLGRYLVEELFENEGEDK